MTSYVAYFRSGMRVTDSIRIKYDNFYCLMILKPHAAAIDLVSIFKKMLHWDLGQLVFKDSFCSYCPMQGENAESAIFPCILQFFWLS